MSFAVNLSKKPTTLIAQQERQAISTFSRTSNKPTTTTLEEAINKIQTLEKENNLLHELFSSAQERLNKLHNLHSKQLIIIDEQAQHINKQAQQYLQLQSENFNLRSLLNEAIHDLESR